MLHKKKCLGKIGTAATDGFCEELALRKLQIAGKKINDRLSADIDSSRFDFLLCTLAGRARMFLSVIEAMAIDICLRPASEMMDGKSSVSVLFIR